MEAKRLTPEEKERMIRRLIWTFELSEIEITWKQAEDAVERALKQPLPDI